MGIFMNNIVDDTYIDFNNPYYSNQLITYLGNKRSLLPFINSGIEFIKKKLGLNKIKTLDGFAGSGVVSRLLKNHSSSLYVNDLEKYSYIVNSCYLSNKSQINQNEINSNIDYLNKLGKEKFFEGFITKNYAPKDDFNIKKNERVFYTHRNAMILDTLKKEINLNFTDNKNYYLGPLIVEASIHTNTSGVFKGFHKKDGIGHFGGSGENALQRIMTEIKLEYPRFSDVECEVNIFQKDINELVKSRETFDLVYYDPPYNQHPYGSNYFMLNILSDENEIIKIQDGVSGISEDWNRSDYNKRNPAILAMNDLIKNTNSKFILISYNNEGIIPFESFKNILETYGKTTIFEQDYNTYRGCRNLKNRNIKVKELLWILEK